LVRARVAAEGSPNRARSLGLAARERNPNGGEMANATMRKFGYPDLLVHEFEHWTVLVRPAQVTLGSLVLAARSDATAYSDLPAEAFAEQGVAIRRIESALRQFCNYERINYLMLMMVDREVHFHVVPRYSGSRQWKGIEFPDSSWPGPPQLKLVVDLNSSQLTSIRDQLKSIF
jgi:diadenosine tetraphosphate (Ap4A) HIT family hydrolase